MPWIKLDTGFFQHPKTAELLAQPKGAEAVAALMRIWCWAGSQDVQAAREGHVSDAMARQIHVTTKQAELLEASGFLHRNGNGWHIHDWCDHQGSLLDKRERDNKKRPRGGEEHE